MLEAMRAHPLGRDAAIIGEVVADHPGMVTMRSLDRRRAGRHACSPENSCRGSVDARMLTLSLHHSIHPERSCRMAEATGPYGRKTQRAPAVKEVHVLWITAGLGCDGDSVSITAATQPSIEDVILGAIPGLPKVHLHNPVLAYENGDEFMKYWYQADEGRLEPVRPGRRGLDPQREDQERGLLGRARHRQAHRATDHDLRMDRPAGPQGAGGRGGRHLRDLRRHPRHGGQPHRLHGPGRLPRLGLADRRPASRSSTCRAARCSPTTSWRRCSTCSTRRRAWRR